VDLCHGKRDAYDGYPEIDPAVEMNYALTDTVANSPESLWTHDKLS
jgi:hypothetical protein